jgi:hypothetical protein
VWEEARAQSGFADPEYAYRVPGQARKIEHFDQRRTPMASLLCHSVMRMVAEFSVLKDSKKDAEQTETNAA